MTDEASAASNAPPETSAPAAPAPAPAPSPAPSPAPAAEPAIPEKPSSSSRAALERAFKVNVAPDVKAAPATDGRARDPATGQFVGQVAESKESKESKEAKPASAAVAADAKPVVVKPAEEVKQAAQVAGAPPDRFAKAAKEAWVNTPEVVRAETERAITQLTAGIEKYKPAAEAFAAIAPYAELARQNNTNLAQVMQGYLNIEQLISQQPLAGILQICQNRGLDPMKVASGILGLQPAQIAQLQQMQAPQQQQQPQQGNGAVPNEWQSRFDQVEDRIAQMTIDNFRSSHAYFDDLRADIAQMIKTGYANDLPDAYAKAVRLNPEVAAKIAADKAPKTEPAMQANPAQTRQKAALSITGSPNPGSNPTDRKPAGSSLEALRSAAAQTGLM